MLKNSLLIVILVFLSSCNHLFDTVDDANDYISDKDNGYLYEKLINGVNYRLTYRPTDLSVMQELGNKKNPQRIVALRKKYGGHLYFLLSLSKDKKEVLNSFAGDGEKFSEAVNELVFGMGEKVHLLTPSKDTIKMTDFVYPRMYGMVDETTIMFIFPRNSKIMNEPYLNFTIEDLGFNTGDVNFKIAMPPLKNEPTLNF